MNFWIQNSRLFLDSRLSNRWSIETFAGTKLFCWCPASYGWDWIRFDQNKKKTFKKKIYISRLFTIFQDFTSIFQTFSKSGKLLGKFEDIFKNSRLATNPVNYYDALQIACLEKGYLNVTAWFVLCFDIKE